MKQIYLIKMSTIRLAVIMIGFLLLFICGCKASAQRITSIQNLSFGDFLSYGLGGTITVTPDYMVIKTGDIIVRDSPTPAIFNLYIEANKTVQMTYSKNVTLVGENGGTLTLEIKDQSITGNGIIVTGASPTRIILGGTMTIGSALVSKVGKYSGIVLVDFTVMN